MTAAASALLVISILSFVLIRSITLFTHRMRIMLSIFGLTSEIVGKPAQRVSHRHTAAEDPKRQGIGVAVGVERHPAREKRAQQINIR